MGRPIGPKRVHRYSVEFKLTAVKLSGMPGESFFHSMKNDAVHGRRFVHPAEFVQLVRSYIPYYNGVRLHSGIGYSSPIDYEARAT
jgi:hypothetical protein